MKVKINGELKMCCGVGAGDFEVHDSTIPLIVEKTGWSEEDIKQVFEINYGLRFKAIVCKRCGKLEYYEESKVEVIE